MIFYISVVCKDFRWKIKELELIWVQDSGDYSNYLLIFKVFRINCGNEYEYFGVKK